MHQVIALHISKTKHIVCTKKNEKKKQTAHTRVCSKAIHTREVYKSIQDPRNENALCEY